MGGCLKAGLLWALFLAGLTTQAFGWWQASELPATADAAVERYRAGDYASAETLWKDAFEAAEAGPERGRLAYNLGNTAFRQDRFTEAVGWYTLGLRYLPRDADAGPNLELARAEAGLDPLDGGGLTDMLRGMVRRFTAAEARWLALLGVLVLGLVLVGEALRGGRGWWWACLTALVCLPLFFAPWIRHALEEPHLHLVLQTGTGGRSEPRMDATNLMRFEAGDVVSVFDEMPGWARVARNDGNDVWVQDSALFPLDR